MKEEKINNNAKGVFFFVQSIELTYVGVCIYTLTFVIDKE